MKRIRINRSAAPNLFTALNMIFGFLCIIFSSKGEYLTASFCILFAAVSDSLDGIIARLTKSSSKFGVELDSLADVISFGVAPSALLYFVHFQSLGTIGLIISTFPMLFAAMRLARFNIQLIGFDKEYFNGLSTTSAAITISSYIIFFSSGAPLSAIEKALLIPLSLFISLLMVSTIKYDTLPKFTKKDIKKNPIKFIIFIAGAILMISTMGKAIFPFFLLYIIVGLVRATIKLINHLLKHNREDNKKVQLSDQ